MSAAMVWALLAALAYSIAIARPSYQHPSRGWLLAAWVLHALALSSGLLGGMLTFGFGSALSVTGWLVVTVYGIESLVLPLLPAQRWLAISGGLCALVGALYPGAPLPASHNPWMVTHMALGIASYGLFATAVMHGAMVQRTEKRMRLALGTLNPAGDMPLLALERLTFRFAQAGFVLLTATLAAGLFFGEHVYGRAWAWRHKEVFSVLAWLVFAILLLARWRMGLRGKKALRLLNAGALLLLLAYVGSRFVMEVVLR